MKYRLLLALTSVLALFGGGGRQPSASEPGTQAEAQGTYSRTKWFSARQLAFSKLVPEPGAPAADNGKTQAFFELASGTRTTYTEFLPNSGIKAFHGLGRLEPISILASPLYRLSDPYTAEHPGTVMVVGFCGDRMFRAQARGTNQQTVLADAVALATNALATLRSQALHP
jgi:hypothetical protein